MQFPQAAPSSSQGQGRAAHFVSVEYKVETQNLANPSSIESQAIVLGSRASSSCLPSVVEEDKKRSDHAPAPAPVTILVVDEKVGKSRPAGFHIPRLGSGGVLAGKAGDNSSRALPPLRAVKRKVTPTAQDKRHWGMNNKINISDINQSGVLNNAWAKERPDLGANASQGEIPRDLGSGRMEAVESGRGDLLLQKSVRQGNGSARVFPSPEGLLEYEGTNLNSNMERGAADENKI